LVVLVLVPCCGFICRTTLADAVPERPGVARIAVPTGNVVVGPVDLTLWVAVGVAHLRTGQSLAETAGARATGIPFADDPAALVSDQSIYCGPVAAPASLDSLLIGELLDRDGWRWLWCAYGL
jgi:hypothetical protein